MTGNTRLGCCHEKVLDCGRIAIEFLQKRLVKSIAVQMIRQLKVRNRFYCPLFHGKSGTGMTVKSMGAQLKTFALVV